MAINVQVFLRRGELQERLTKRFFKKCKKEDILREYLEKTSYYKSPSEIRRKRMLEAKLAAKRDKNSHKYKKYRK